MIPTMIMFGLLVGWWWRSALVAGAVLWPLLLWRGGIYDDLESVPGGALGLTVGAALLGAANTGVGVAVDQAVLAVVRRVRRPRPGSADGTPATPQPAPTELG